MEEYIMPNGSMLTSVLVGIAGILIGILVMRILGNAGLDRARNQAQSILDESNAKAENILRQADLDGKQQVYEMTLQAERELKAQRSKVQ